MLRVLRPLVVLDVLPPAVVTGGCVGVVVALGWIDHAIGTRIGLSALYLAPVVVASWSAGRGSGLLTAVVASVAWLLADLGAGASIGIADLATRNLVSHSIICLGLAMMVSALRRSIDALDAAFERERRMARHDPLTGLLNARVFHEAVTSELARMGRTGEPLTVAYVDADGFKAVNDSRGHREGDRVLGAIATTLLRVQRRTDTVARLGGDEFAVLMPGTTRDEAIVALAKVRTALAAAMAQGGWRVTFSVGASAVAASNAAEVTVLPPSAEGLIADADMAMFMAKRRGGDRVEVRVHTAGSQGELFPPVHGRAMAARMDGAA